MQVVASTPTSEIANVIGNWGADSVPSATAMTKKTRKTPAVWAPAAARRAASQDRGVVPLPPRAWKIANAIPVQRDNSARLKANFVGLWRRWNESARPDPTTCAASSAAGEEQNRPNTRPT